MATRNNAAAAANASKFFGEGLTFDDVLLVPAYSEILPTGVDITSNLTANISLF